MFVGDGDTIGDPADAELIREALGDAAVHYQMIHGGHLTFLAGKDMSYFTKDVMDLLAKYHPLSKETENSSFYPWSNFLQ